MSAEPQVCSTAVSAIWAPRCLGSAAIRIRVSAAALNRMALAPDQVLFLDDGAVNVDGALELGLVAHLVKNSVQTELVLKKYAVL